MSLDETVERVRHGLDLLSQGPNDPGFVAYLETVKKEDHLAFSLLRVARYVSQFKPEKAIDLVNKERLLSKVSARPELQLTIYNRLSMAYGQLGNLAFSEDYARRAVELSKEFNIPTNAHMNLFEAQLRLRDYKGLRKEIGEFLKSLNNDTLPLPQDHSKELARCRMINWAQYLLAYADTIEGRLSKARDRFKKILSDKIGVGNTDAPPVLEAYALCLRLSGKPGEAIELYESSLKLCLENEIARAAIPCARLVELAEMGLPCAPSEETIQRCKALAQEGGKAEALAAQELEAFLRRDWEKILEAAQNYNANSYPVEAFTAGLSAAFFGYRDDTAAFPKAIKFLSSLGYLYEGFRKDPVLGGYLMKIEPFLKNQPGQYENRIGAYLIGEFKVLVDGKEIPTARWGERRAILAFVYLLLHEKHSVAPDHLVELLWPRKTLKDKNLKEGLYRIISLIRKHLGDSGLLTKKGDFYQLEDVWTDLGELENLVRLADPTADPAQKEEYLARARELAQGELLPEFPYDKHIEEYRGYYERLRRKIFTERQG